jgi:hypothetical protein
MENQNFSKETNTIFNGGKQPLPNATAVLVLGIVSLVGCCCYSIPGLVCSIIALILGNKDLKMYYSNPTAFTESSLNNLKAGRVCAIIALIISILYLLMIIWAVAMVGIENLGDPQKVREIIYHGR